MEPACRNCIHAEHKSTTTTATGTLLETFACRLNPPAIMPVTSFGESEVKSVQPIVRGQDYCRHFTDRVAEDTGPAPRCGDCRHAQREDDLLTCRYNPPTVVSLYADGEYTAVTGWPRIHPDEHCGKFQSR